VYHVHVHKQVNIQGRQKARSCLYNLTFSPFVYNRNFSRGKLCTASVSRKCLLVQSDCLCPGYSRGLLPGPHWSVVIDTLALPDETVGMREFIEHELGVPVRYVINTHYHADHTWGNCFFPGATIISHSRCRDLLTDGVFLPWKLPASRTRPCGRSKSFCPT